jgi:sec-independent protein translocase protein TatA
MRDDETALDKPDPVKSIDHNSASPQATRSDVGSKAV